MTQPTPHAETLHGKASRPLLWVAKVARIALWITLAGWLVFGASWTLLHGWIVPRIGEFRPRIEAAAGKALGLRVRIGQISARSEGLVPSFELKDIVLLTPQGHEALRLPRVLASLSPSSVWKQGFEQLSIEQPSLEIRRSVDGKINVGGLDISSGQGDGNGVADWIFSQPELSIKGGSVRWIDDMRGAPPLDLKQVDAVLRSGLRSHKMRLDASPPADVGQRFSLRGIFTRPLLSANPGRWTDWSGHIYAMFDQLDVSLVKRYAPLEDAGIDLRTGFGSLRVWGEVRSGEVIEATADAALGDLDVKAGKTLEPLAFVSLAGRFGARQLADGFELSARGLAFSSKDGTRGSAGNLALIRTGVLDQTAQKNELSVSALDLAGVAQIATRLPLGTATHAAITSYAPRGVVETLDARWQVPLTGPVTFSAKGKVRGLELAALAQPPASGAATGSAESPHDRAGRPGLSGAGIDFDVTQLGGRATLTISKGALELPGIFEEPRIPLDSLSLEAQWKSTDGSVSAQLRNIRFASADAAGQAQVSWRSAAPGSKKEGPLGVIDLQGSLSRADGAKVHRYLPLVLPEKTRHYVRDAVIQGDASDVRFRVKGPVDYLPFSDPALGDFKVSAKVRNARLAYVPAAFAAKPSLPWPALTDLSGELVFNRAALEITAASAKISGVQLVRADAHIADLMHSATLVLNASLKGALPDALAFVNTSPVSIMTGQALRQTVASGMADYGLHLDMPLGAIERTRVQGTVSLPGNDVQFTPVLPTLTRLKGVATFDEAGFNVPAAQARWLGGEVRFEGGSRAETKNSIGNMEPSVLFRIQGTLTAEGLRQARELGVAAQMAQKTSGATAYSATLAIRRSAMELMVSSNLQGLALDFPAPLHKAAEAALPVRFENTLLRDSLLPGEKLRDQVSLELGQIASLVYLRDVSGSEPAVIRGGIGVGLAPGEAMPLPASGVAANINLQALDLDAWSKVMNLPNLPPAAAPAGPPPAAPAGPPPAGPGGTAPGLGYLPTSIAVRAQQLQWDGRKLNNVVAGGSREGLTWRANVAAAELNGYVEFRQPGGAGAGRLYARLSRLNLAQSTASEVETILDEQPVNIPALDIVVEEMELGGRKLGRVEIDAVNRGRQTVLREGGVREWRLNKFNITLPEAVLTASGNWAPAAPADGSGVPASDRPASRAGAERKRTVMNFKLDITDSGELLKRFGMVDVIRRGRGKMEGQVAWTGSPLSPDYPSMGGQFNVNIESGQFLKADPGIAKLLGVLSLQSLPRRLTLDFRDVFSEGFGFDFVRGDVNISQGVASTNNLQMKGVNAAVLMEGSADIARETQDLRVIVVPEINAGTASLIATVINPAIGLGSFLAQYFLRRPLIQATTQELHIDGSWSEPKITKIERKP